MITGDIRQKYRIDEEAEETWYEVERIISRNKEYFTYFVECCSSYNYQDIRRLFADKGKDYEEQFEAVDLIHKKKYLFKTILEKGFVKRKRPFVIEFIGTPRTGKTTVINNLYEFFKKAGYKILLIEELTTSKYYKEEVLPHKKEMTIGEYNLHIMHVAFDQLKQAIESDYDVVLIDRGINDRQIWNYIRLQKGDLSGEDCQKAMHTYGEFSRKWINVLVQLKVDAKTSVERDYISTLSLETRRFNNITNIEEYNLAMDSMTDFHKNAVKHFVAIDTKKITPVQTSIIVANKVLDNMLTFAISGDVA